MATSANRLYKIVRAKKVDTGSQLVAFTVISTSPLVLNNGDKVTLPSDFFVFSGRIDKSKISVGDRFLAISLNNTQLYYIQDIISSTNQLYTYEAEIEDLNRRVTALENRL